MGRRRLRLTGIPAVLLLASCGSSGSPATGPSTATPRALSGSLTVLAAASLTEAFTDARPTLEAANPGFSVTFSFAGSQQLVTEVIDGAPADVIATADQVTMQKLVSAGLVEAPVTFARNRLEIAVAPGNPKGIHSLADLARSDVSVVLAAPAVPAGNFAKQVLAKANVAVTPKSLELDVKTVLEKVESGDADAAIVYTTDVAAAGSMVSGVVIPDAQNIIATYPIAVVKATQDLAAATAFVREAASGAVQKALRKRGFLPP